MDAKPLFHYSLHKKNNNKFTIDGVLLVLVTKLHIRFNIYSLNSNTSFNVYSSKILKYILQDIYSFSTINCIR